MYVRNYAVYKLQGLSASHISIYGHMHWFMYNTVKLAKQHSIQYYKDITILKLQAVLNNKIMLQCYACMMLMILKHGRELDISN